jgi:hypothetical protein
VVKDAVQVSKQVKAETLLNARPRMLPTGLSNHAFLICRQPKYTNKVSTIIVKSSDFCDSTKDLFDWEAEN